MSLQTIATSTPKSSSSTATGPVDWTIDSSHTSVTFGVRHMMVSTVRGEFQKVHGGVTWDAQDPNNTVIDVTIDAASINTREEKRDQHLKSADFFDVEKFPVLTFKSSGTTATKNGTLYVMGDLTIRDVTRKVTLEVEGPTPEHADPWGFIRMGASAKTKIKRSEFGMTWNAALEAGGILVGDEISIQLDIELQRAK